MMYFIIILQILICHKKGNYWLTEFFCGNKTVEKIFSCPIKKIFYNLSTFTLLYNTEVQKS